MFRLWFVSLEQFISYTLKEGSFDGNVYIPSQIKYHSQPKNDLMYGIIRRIFSPFKKCFVLLLQL